MFSFERVIAPYTPDQFFAEYWEQKPLLVLRSEASYYRELLTYADIDHLLTTAHLQYPLMRMVRQGNVIAIRDYTKDVAFGRSFTCLDVIDPDKAITEFQKGATLIFQGLHRMWPSLAIFSRDLEKTFTHGIQTNIYLTPRGSQGFAPHYDTHDVFVLQISGTKHWKIYGDPVYLPDRNEPHDKNAPVPTEVIAEFDLNAGDMVYIPRGFIHEGATSTTESLHITLGVTTYTWGTVLSEIMQQCKADPQFRQSLPIGFATDPNSAGQLEGRFRELLANALAKADLPRALENISEKYIQTRPPILTGHLLETDRVDEIGPDTALHVRDHVLFLVKPLGDKVEIMFHGKVVSLPAFTEPAIRYAADARAFRPAELPGSLDDDAKLVLCRRLVREGWLTFAERA